MVFLSFKALFSVGFTMGLIAIHFATPLPPAKRSTTSNDATKSGFSTVPKVLEIQLPLKIVSKDDLVSWAKYVMSLMASRINITFSSIKDANTSTRNVVRNSFSEPVAPPTVPRSPLQNGDRLASSNFPRQGDSDVSGPQKTLIKNAESGPIDPRFENFQGLSLPQLFVGFGSPYPTDKGKNQELTALARSQTPFNIFDGNQALIAFSRNQAQYNSLYPTDGSKFQEPGALTGQQSPFNTLFSPTGSKNQEAPSLSGHQNQFNLIYPTNGVNTEALSKQQSYLNSLHHPDGIKNQEHFNADNKNSEITRQTKSQDSAAGNNPYDQKELEIFKNANILAVPVQTRFLPLPLKVTDGPTYRDEEVRSRYYYDGAERNGTSNLGTDSRRTTPSHRFRNEPEDFSLSSVKRNTTAPLKSLTVPFQAYITITQDKPEEQTTNKNERKDLFTLPVRDPPDEFPPYFPKNFTTINESGKISVILDDSETKTDVKKEVPEKNGSMKKQNNVLSELLLALGLKRRNGTKNNTDITVTPPVIKILKGPSSQKVQSLDNETTQGRGRHNETSNQEIEQEESDEQSEEPEESDDDQKANQEDGEQGGSLQAILELLPLIVPILEDISAPNSDVDLTELVNAAVPLLEGLSEGDEETPGVDVAAALVPILTRLSNGPNGQGVDSAAVLPPIIQIVGPLIGAIIGPLSGPIIRALSSPGQGGSDFSAIVQSVAAPLSTPTGYGKMSPFSNIVAGIVSSLSKDFVSGGSDVSALVSAVVSGVLSGASAGSKSGKRGYPDSAYSPTSYGGYGGNNQNNRGNPGYGSYGPPVPAYTVSPIQLIGTSIKELLGAGSKAVTAVFTAITGLLGASSKDPGYPSYGPPDKYKPPPSYGPPSTTRSPYVAASPLRPPPPPRQIRPQRQKI